MVEENKILTEAQIEQRIQKNMEFVISRKYSRAYMQAEYRKFCILYRVAVMEGTHTTGVYIWKETYRRILCLQ